MKKYIVSLVIIVVIILGSALKISITAARRYKDLSERQETNYLESKKTISQLSITTKELKDGYVKMSGLTDSLIDKVADINIENITNITEVHNHYVDTVTKTITLIEKEKGIYPIALSHKCYGIFGNLDLNNSSPELNIDSVETNNTTSIVGSVYPGNKFLFFKWNWKTELNAISSCGSVKVAKVDIEVSNRKKAKK